MRKILFLLLPLLFQGVSLLADQTGPWAQPSSITQVVATAVTGTTMFGASTSVDPWANASLFPYSLTKSVSTSSPASYGGGRWQPQYPVRMLVTNPSGYSLQVWYQSNTPSAAVYGAIVPAGSSFIWPSPIGWPARVYATTTNTAAVSYGVSLWR